MKSQLLRTSDVGYIDDDLFSRLYDNSIEIGKLLFSQIFSTRNSEIAGMKYRNS